MDINKVYLTGTVSAVSYKTQRNSFKLKFSLKTEGQNSESPDSCKKSKKDGASRDLALYADYHEVYMFNQKNEAEQKRLYQIVRCGNRVTSKVLAKEIKLRSYR